MCSRCACVLHTAPISHEMGTCFPLNAQHVCVYMHACVWQLRFRGQHVSAHAAGSTEEEAVEEGDSPCPSPQEVIVRTEVESPVQDAAFLKDIRRR